MNSHELIIEELKRLGPKNLKFGLRGDSGDDGRGSSWAVFLSHRYIGRLCILDHNILYSHFYNGKGPIFIEWCLGDPKCFENVICVLKSRDDY